MKQYELTLLLSKKEDLNLVKKILEENGAAVEKEESWGEKKLAYPVKKQRSAYFFTLYIKTNPSNLLEIKKKLNYEEKILRFLLLLVNK